MIILLQVVPTLDGLCERGNELPVPAFVAGVAAAYPFGHAGRVAGGVAPFVSLRGHPFGHDVLREMRCCRSLTPPYGGLRRGRYPARGRCLCWIGRSKVNYDDDFTLTTTSTGSMRRLPLPQGGVRMSTHCGASIGFRRVHVKQSDDGCTAFCTW